MKQILRSLIVFSLLLSHSKASFAMTRAASVGTETQTTQTDQGSTAKDHLSSWKKLAQALLIKKQSEQMSELKDLARQMRKQKTEAQASPGALALTQIPTPLTPGSRPVRQYMTRLQEPVGRAFTFSSTHSHASECGSKSPHSSAGLRLGAGTLDDALSATPAQLIALGQFFESLYRNPKLTQQIQTLLAQASSQISSQDNRMQSASEILNERTHGHSSALAPARMPNPKLQDDVFLGQTFLTLIGQYASQAQGEQIHLIRKLAYQFKAQQASRAQNTPDDLDLSDSGFYSESDSAASSAASAASAVHPHTSDFARKPVASAALSDEFSERFLPTLDLQHLDSALHFARYYSRSDCLRGAGSGSVPLPIHADSGLSAGVLTDADSDKMDLESSWVILPSAPIEDRSSLLSYTMQRDSAGKEKPDFSLNPVLSETTYKDVLTFNDLSYAHATGHTTSDAEKRTALMRRLQETSDQLYRRGWSRIMTLFGATGARNQDADAAVVGSYHADRNLIVIAFHGSRNGSKLPIWHDGSGDWGSNYERTAVTAASVGLEHIPGDITVHKGFAQNFQSTQSNIQAYLQELLSRIPAETRQNTWVIVTGHSKGAAVASIAAPAIKGYLMSHAATQGVKVGTILFSAPRAYYGDAARLWVHETLGQRNILRVNVYGDVVPHAPLSYWMGARSIGVLALDQQAKVSERSQRKYNRSLGGYFDGSSWFSFHYVASLRGTGSEFNPDIVLSYQELLTAVTEGQRHQESKGDYSLQSSTHDRAQRD